MRDLREIKTFLLDMDGTIYLSNRLFDCTTPFLDCLRAQGKRYIFLTNNSSRNRHVYYKKLRNMGIPVKLDDIFTSGEATTIYMNRRAPGARVYLVGTPSLTAEFRRAGINLVDENPDFVILGFDQTLTYKKLVKLCNLVSAGVPFIATHPDYVCPVEGGSIPDVGAMLALVKVATGGEPEYVVGKPNRGMIDALCEKYGLRPDEIAVAGDRLYTDVAVGLNSGATAILVLSCETTREDLAKSDIVPDYVFEDLSGITRILAGVDN